MTTNSNLCQRVKRRLRIIGVLIRDVCAYVERNTAMHLACSRVIERNGTVCRLPLKNAGQPVEIATIVKTAPAFLCDELGNGIKTIFTRFPFSKPDDISR